MKPSYLGLALVLSDRTYQGLVRLFPPVFRQMFGPRMARMFRECCRDAVQHQGLKGLMHLWLHTLSDITVNLMLEWGATLHKRVGDFWPSLLSPLVGLLAGYAYLHADITQGLIFFPLVCVMYVGLLGYLRPEGTWEWALLLGAGVPFVRLINIITGSQLPCHMYLIAMLLAVGSGLVGAFCGIALGAMIRGFSLRVCLVIMGSRQG